MHLTVHTRGDVPSLRTDVAMGVFRDLLAGARQRGVRTVALTIMPTHVHWVVVPESAAALRDATRYVFGQFARRLDVLLGRRGRVFVERFWSVCAKAARHAWNLLGYVLRNPAAAGLRRRRGGGSGDGWGGATAGRLDRFTEVDFETLDADPFLRGLLGPDGAERCRLILRMAREAVPYAPLRERLQPVLPGL